jgi:CheY-like chemotaxis protein
VAGELVLVHRISNTQNRFRLALQQTGLPYTITPFKTAQQGLDYPRTTAESPFLILSGMQLQGVRSIEFRQQIEDDPVLKAKAIPFLFITDPILEGKAKQAYKLTIQGYFELKAYSDAFVEELTYIIKYWERCVDPNRFRGQ